MIAVIGKSLLYFLTACALVGVGSQIIRGPNGGVTTREMRSAPEHTGPPVRPHCDYVQFAQKADSTWWEDICVGGKKPWDTVVVVRPDP